VSSPSASKLPEAFSEYGAERSQQLGGDAREAGLQRESLSCRQIPPGGQ